MIKKIINFFLNFYIRIFSHKFFLNFHNFLIHASLRSIGYKNFENFKVTGEKNLLNKISKYNIKTSIDIGANIGDYSREIILSTNSYVVAIEPMPKSFNKLKHLEKKFSNKIKCFNIALSNKIEKRNIYFQSSRSKLASFEENIKHLNYIEKKIKIKKIKTLTLDYFVNKEKKLFLKGIDFIKIDTEGFDYQVLLGSLKTIKKYKPKFIQFEMNWHYLFSGINLYRICSKFEDYNIFRILPYNSGIIKINYLHPNNNIFQLSNFIMARKDVKIK